MFNPARTEGCIMIKIIPEPTARSAVPGVSPGRGFLIPLRVSQVQSHCSWAKGEGNKIFSVRYVITSCSH